MVCKRMEPVHPLNDKDSAFALERAMADALPPRALGNWRTAEEVAAKVLAFMHERGTVLFQHEAPLPGPAPDFWAGQRRPGADA